MIDIQRVHAIFKKAGFVRSNVPGVWRRGDEVANLDLEGFSEEDLKIFLADRAILYGLDLDGLDN